MNTRLEIASRVLGAVLSTNAVAPRGSVSFALALADDLILAEEATRRDNPTSEDQAYDVAVAHDFLVNDLGILRGQINAMLDGAECRVAQLNTIARSLDVILAKDRARKQGAIAQCGSLSDYRIDLATAQIAYDANATRKVEPAITANDSQLAAEIRTFIREMEQGKDLGVAVSYVVQELRIMLERENAMVKPIQNHGTLSDFRIDVAAAQIAFDADPSAQNASILSAAKEALARRHQ